MAGRNFIFSVVLFFILNCIAVSQNSSQYTYRNYTILNGLPSNEVYNVFCDSKGELWFSTAGGACRFDGEKFIRFTRAEGLQDNTVFKLIEDNKGRVWAVTFLSGLSYIQNNKVHLFKYNSEIEKSYTQASETTLGFLSASCDSFVVAPYQATTTYISFSGHGQISEDFSDGITKTTAIVNSFYDATGKLSWYNKRVKFNGHSMELRYQDKTDNDSLLFSSDTIETTVHDRVVNINNETWIYTNKKNAYLIKKGRLERIYRLPDQILRVFMDENSLMFGLRNKGLVKYEHYMDQNFSFILKDVSVTAICKDKENGYWVSSLENGVYYFPGFYFTNFSSYETNKPAFYTALVFNGTNIYCGSKNGKIEKWTRNKKHELTLSNSSEEGPIWKMHRDPLNENVWLSSSNWGGFISGNSIKKVETVAASLSFLRKDDWMYTGHWISMSGVKDGMHDTKNIFYPAKKLRFEVLMPGAKDEILIGSMDGLYSYNFKTDNFRKIILKDSLARQPRVVCYLNDIKGHIFLGTKGNGLLKVNHSGKVLEIIDHNDGLPNDNIIKIKKYGNNLLLLSENGISILQRSGDREKVIQFLDYSSGLNNSDFSDIEIVGTDLWAVGSKGIDVIDLSVLDKETNLLFRISGINISGKDTMGNSFTLPYNKNAVTLRYQLITYRNQERKAFRYRIINRDSAWKITKNTELNFVDLSPGTYKIELGSTNGWKWSDTLSLDIHIGYPFWLTWWFIAIEIILAALFLYLGLKFYFERIRIRTENKIRQKQHITELELKALRAQINPHFIFNVLYSIQHYILFNQKEDAQKYLNKFARLLRNILQNSEKNLVTVEEEIAVLELYLDLEEMRFEKKFTHRIAVDDAIDQKTTWLPTLLLQPIIENAIKHGVAQLKSDGLITIEFKKENAGQPNGQEKLICTVQDNGVGRNTKKEPEKPFEEYKSMGLGITRDRIKALGDQFFAETKLTIFDMNSGSHLQRGTKVVIELPLVKK